MLKNYTILTTALTALITSSVCAASNVSFFVGFSQPAMIQPTMMRPAYMPVPHIRKRCYVEPPVYMNGIVYPGNRICEQRLVANTTPWVAPENGPGYYRIHRHHITYKYY